MNMFTNRLHTIRTAKSKPKPKQYSELRVECVVYELSDFDEILKIVRDNCHELNVLFTTRKFNSSKYSNDRNEIKKLPAFHIYINDQYKNTIYPDSDTIKIIKMELAFYNDKLERKKRKKLEREIYYADLYNWFTSCFIYK